MAMIAFVLFRSIMGDVELAVATLPWLLFLVFWVWMFETMARRGQAARSLPPVDHRVDFPFVHIFSEKGLRIETAGGATELYWSGMFKVREEEGYFLCFWNEACAHYTPKRALSIDSQNRLRTLLKHKLGDRAEVLGLLTDRAGQTRDVV